MKMMMNMMSIGGLPCSGTTPRLFYIPHVVKGRPTRCVYQRNRLNTIRAFSSALGNPSTPELVRALGVDR